VRAATVLLVTACASPTTPNTPTEPTTPTTPVVQNQYRPTLATLLSYPEPTVLGIVSASDQDAQGIGYTCTLNKPDGTQQTYQRNVAGATITDTIKQTEARSTNEKQVALSCTANAQNETAAANATLIIPAQPTVPTTPLPGAILDLNARGANNKTYRENLTDLTNFLFNPAFHLAEIRTVNNKPHMVVPWYSRSDVSTEAALKTYSRVTSASYNHFVMVSDELSELCFIVAAGTDGNRMDACKNTMETLRGNAGLPGWVAEVNGNAISLISQDPASDATARFGLALYTAAKNPAFSSAQQQSYKTLGDTFLRQHMQVEYATSTPIRSSVSGRTMTKWAAGGAGTASAGVSGMEMWIGYYADIAKFLLAGYASTHDATVLTRAHDVIDQFLIATTFNPAQPRASVGYMHFGWNTSSGTVVPTAPSPGDWYFTAGNPSWDAADAPRALWMPDVLRAAQLAGEDITNGIYPLLQQWSAALIATGTQSATSACIQYYADAKPVSGNCGSGHFNNGLGAGLFTASNPSWVRSKVDQGLSQVNWGAQSYYGMSVPGVYANRLPKVMIAAGGLDAAAFRY
jgi:hypothetical protein